MKGDIASDSAGVYEGCPIKHNDRSSNNSVDLTHLLTKEESTNRDKCPVKGDGDQKAKNNSTNNSTSGSDGRGQEYNVYSQPIDPRNNMPFNANQTPRLGQEKPLSVERVQSSIPKGGADGGKTWSYPSSQMFYNSLYRKGKGDGVHAEDVDMVVAIHNNMNERTWRRVVEWERLHPECDCPKLTRFIGRPNDLSPRALFRMWFGGMPEPFDRHDWTVDRCGREVRYVIDYYFKDEIAQSDSMPTLHSDDSMRGIEVDVRPALDSSKSLVDRFRMAARRFRQTAAESSERPRNTASKTKETVTPSTIDVSLKISDSVIESSAGTTVRELADRMNQSCRSSVEKLHMCQGADECSQATVGVSYCAASIVCPDIADDFMRAMNANAPETEVATRFDAMTQCVDAFRERVTSINLNMTNDSNTQ